jgi:SagB-type dehydrogenase family enzyme
MATSKLARIDHDLILNRLISKRKSIRSFSSKELDNEQAANLLWACQGMNEYDRRTTPSAGALYPIEVYYLDQKRFAHYLPQVHALEILTRADLRDQLARAALSQEFIAQAPGTIVITAVYERVTIKYGTPRGIRYVDMEAGHAAQNVLLQATALGLGSVPVGAFNDEGVCKLLSLPKDHVPLYLLPVGYTSE